MAFFRNSDAPGKAQTRKEAGDRRRQQLQAQQQMLDKRKADEAGSVEIG